MVIVVQVPHVSERKRMEAERIEMQQKSDLASRLVMVGGMASGIAHEINNPLTAVIGFSELAMRKDMPEGLIKDIERINGGAKRVATIVARLLSFARQQRPQRGYISINELLENTLALRRYEMDTNSISLVTRLEPGLPYIMADAGQLQ